MCVDTFVVDGVKLKITAGTCDNLTGLHSRSDDTKPGALAGGRNVKPKGWRGHTVHVYERAGTLLLRDIR